MSQLQWIIPTVFYDSIDFAIKHKGKYITGVDKTNSITAKYNHSK